MQIFVTGASGFIGGAVARGLQGEHTVRAMSRSEAGDAKIRALGAAPVRCSLDDVQAEHLAGCDAVIHSAAMVGQWGTREAFFAANVHGTEAVLKAAREAGVRRFVHVGTEAALFRGQDLIDVDETHPYAVGTPFLYSESKAEAEKRVLAANDPEHGFTTLSIRPRFVWGPGDQTVLPELKRMIGKGAFRWIDGGRAQTSTAHIDNVVHALRLALEKGHGGEAYFVSDGPPMTFREFLTSLLATEGITPPDKSVPGWLARGAARVMEGLWKLAGSKQGPPMTYLAACMLSRSITIRTDKARAELGYEPVVSVERALAEMRSGSE